MPKSREQKFLKFQGDMENKYRSDFNIQKLSKKDLIALIELMAESNEQTKKKLHHVEQVLKSLEAPKEEKRIVLM